MRTMASIAALATLAAHVLVQDAFVVEHRAGSFDGTAIAKVESEVKADGPGDTGYPRYFSRGWPEIRSKATGFFRTEKIGDTWWVIDPAGNAFFLIGTDHVNYNVHWCEKLGYAPYHKNIEAMYGSEERWAKRAVNRLVSWRFNCLAANNSPSTRHRGLPHMEFLGMGAGFASVDYITEKTTWTGFPNVFSREFEEYCDRIAKERCAPNREDPWLIGYFVDNELEWYGKSGSLLSDAFKRPADNSAKIALVRFLEDRYNGDVEAFNRVWDADARDFDELLTRTKCPAAKTNKAQDDIREFARLVADRYFAVTSAAIRRHDPNHMVLGCRFAGRAPDCWDLAGKYFDIVSVNCYRRLDLEKGVMLDGFDEELESWYKQARKPLMITEWSFPALDTPLPSQHGAGQRVPTQKDRARAFTIFQKLLFRKPFVVGSDYFMWVDEPALGISASFPEDSNYGLVNERDEPYELLTRAATELHSLVYAIHSGNTPSLYVRPAEREGMFVVGNAGRAPAAGVVSVWVDGKLTKHDVHLGGGESVTMGAEAEELRSPGGHLITCRIEPENPLLDPDETDNTASSVVYVSPSRERRPDDARQIPILIINPTDAGLARDSIPIVVRTKDIGIDGGPLRVSRVMAESRESVPLQVIPDEVLMGVSDLSAHGCLTLYADRSAPETASKESVRLSRTGDGFEIDNGVLRFEHRNGSGNAFDSIHCFETEVGSFHPIIHQRTGQDFWVRPTRVESVETFEGPVGLVIDMTFAFGGETAGTITEVDRDGKFTPVQSRPHGYRTKYRFYIYPQAQYYDARMLWVENTDAEPWLFETYFHYIPSKIGGDMSDDYAKMERWTDASGMSYGALVPGEFNVNLWKDPGGNQHPDVHRHPPISRLLMPGERLAANDRPVHIVAGDRDDFDRAASFLRALDSLEIRVMKPE